MYEALLAAALLAMAPPPPPTPQGPPPDAPVEEVERTLSGPPEDGDRSENYIPEKVEETGDKIDELGPHNIHNLAQALTAVVLGKPATKNQKTALTTRLMALPRGVKPSEESVNQLVTDLSGLKAGGRITDENAEKLAAALAPIFDAEIMPDNEVTQHINQLGKLLGEVGIPETAADKVVQDMKNIVKEILAAKAEKNK